MKLSARARVIMVLSCVIGLVLIGYIFIGTQLQFAVVKEYAGQLQRFVHAHYISSLLLFWAIIVCGVICLLPCVAMMTLLGGFLFGTVQGVVYSNIGAVIGGTLSFLLIRYLIGSWVQDTYADRMRRFNKRFAQSQAWYLLAIRLVVVVPFCVTNVLAGLTKVSVWTFMWTTSLGIIPVSTVYAYAGQQLNTLNSLCDIFSVRMLFAFGLLGFVSLMPVMLRSVRKRLS